MSSLFFFVLSKVGALVGLVKDSAEAFLKLEAGMEAVGKMEARLGEVEKVILKN